MNKLVFLLALAGCDLYFGNNNPPPPVCEGVGGGAIAAEHLRDPSTGQCSYYGGGGGCDPSCGPCPLKTPVMPEPGFPSCDGPCENLDEASCAGTPACHASYIWDGVENTFDACWDIQPLPVLEGGDCTTLDLFACAQHDDCASVLGDDSTGGLSFASCISDATASVCAGVDCGPGTHCEPQCKACDPEPDGTCDSTCSPTCVADTKCDSVDCGPGYACTTTCDANGNCTPVCVPQTGDPGSCSGAVACDEAPPACPANTTPGIANGCYTGYCIPLAACGNDAGTCDGATCGAPPPACPDGTVPGVLAGCWSGYCIPTADCPIQMCGDITDEKTCIATGCVAIYTGTDCTCDASGTCTCATETFSYCESGGF